MSANTMMVYGMGFEMGTTTQDMAEFIMSRYELVEENFHEFSSEEHALFEAIDKLCEERKEVEEGFFDRFENITCHVTGHEGGAYALISHMMSLETGISFQYEPGQGDCDSHPSILLAETMPWNYNTRERGLDESELMYILNRYAEELNNESGADYLAIEYYA